MPSNPASLSHGKTEASQISPTPLRYVSGSDTDASIGSQHVCDASINGPLRSDMIYTPASGRRSGAASCDWTALMTNSVLSVLSVDGTCALSAAGHRARFGI